VFDHESDIFLFQWTGLLPVGILAVQQVNVSRKDRIENTNIFSGRKMIPLKEVPAASPAK